MNEIEKVYEEFWKDIVENPDGTINLDQVKMELYDFKVVMDEVSQVYCDITNGRISKPNTLHQHVIDIVEEDRQKLIRLLQAASSALKSYQYGNQSPELAESISKAIDDYI